MRQSLKRAAIFAALVFADGALAPALAQDVTLTARDGALSIDGTLQGYDGEVFRILSAYGPLTVDAERMGLPGEPEPGAILRTRRGPFIEVFPEGVTAAEICRLRLGTARRSPAGRIALTLRGSALVALINSKLASYLSAPDRIRDLGDVQSIIAARRLTAAFATRLHPAVRAAFLRAVPRR